MKREKHKFMKQKKYENARNEKMYKERGRESYAVDRVRGEWSGKEEELRWKREWLNRVINVKCEKGF